MSARRGLEIRAATPADAAGLSDLLGGACGSSIELAGRLDRMRDGAGTVLIALDWGPPTGVIALHWFTGLQDARPIAQIDMLLVDSEDRRRGIGRLLVKAAAQAARVAGCGRIDLVAGERQMALRAFCLATGFAETGLRFERALRKAAS